MFELSGVNYEEVLGARGFNFSSSYREFELSGVRVIRGSSYQGFELSGVRVIRGSSYQGFELSGVRVIRDSSYQGLLYFSRKFPVKDQDKCSFYHRIL